MKKIYLAAVLAMYFSTVVNAQVTFDYTGDVQMYVVTGCVDSLLVDVLGAEGGRGPVGCTTGTSKAGGKGGRVQATIPVSQGDTLYIYVGGKGEDDDLNSALGGYNGGGDALDDSQYSYYGGGGGGGASDIRLNGMTLNDRIVVAGGGGGAGADGCSCNDLKGGDGGDLTGGNGQGGQGCVCNPSGQGGTQSAGGAKGDWACVCDAEDGGLGQGGNSNSTSCGGPTGGGGGGGGYYGGGGGGLGAGGGGSSYTFSSATSVTHTQGYQEGNGQVIITPIGGMTITVSVTPNDTVCAGTLVTLSGSGADAFFWDNGVLDGVPFKATETTTYMATGINANECSDTASLTLFVYPSILASFQMAAGDTVCTNETPITLTGGSPDGGTYSGNAVSNGIFFPLNATPDAWNTITYSVTDQYGCSGEATDSVYVTICSSTGLIDNSRIRVFPNPTDGLIHLESQHRAEVIIHNMMGEEVLRQQVSEGMNDLHLPFASGIYTLKFIGNGIRIFRIVVN